MGLGPSKEQLIEQAIKNLPGLPSVTKNESDGSQKSLTFPGCCHDESIFIKLTFPGCYHMESTILSEKAEILKYCKATSKIGGLLFEKFEVPYASSLLDILLDYLSVESDLLALNIEQNVINHLNTSIRNEIEVVKDTYELLKANDLRDYERTGYIISGITACRKIVKLFDDKKSHLFKNPLACSPILDSLVPTYINMLTMNFSETKSKSVRDNLVRQVKELKSIADSHIDRATTERMNHIRGEICPVPGDGSYYIYYDYIYSAKFELCSVWFPGESISFRTRLSCSDVDEKVIPVYKIKVMELLNEYFEASSAVINAMSMKLKNEQ